MKCGGVGCIQHALVKSDWGPARVSSYKIIINKQKYRENGLIQVVTSL